MDEVMKLTLSKLLILFFSLVLTQIVLAQESQETTPQQPVETIGVVQPTEQPVTQENTEDTTQITTEGESTLTPVQPSENTLKPEQAIESLPQATSEVTANTWWKPTPNTTWQWQISSPYDDGEIEAALDVEVYDIDLFDTPQAQIDYLKSQNKKIICYFSAGTWEEWREDIIALEARFEGDPKLDLVKGNRMPWPGEWWINPRHPITRALMETRLDYAVARGCDGVEPDNVDSWTYDLTAFPNSTQVAHNWQYNIPEWPCEDPPFLDEIEEKGTGFNLIAEDQLDYNSWMAQAAHERGLSIGLKNNGAQAKELEPFYDWSLVESCYDYSECHDHNVFIQANKAVFMTQYVPDCVLKDDRANSLNGILSVKPELIQGMTEAMTNMCSDARTNQFSLLVKRYDLEAWNLECSGF